MLRPPPRLDAMLRPPQPQALRRVWCPECDHTFDVSARAMSLRCPHCAAGIEPADLELQASVQGDVKVIGHVTIPAEMEMRGRLLCVQLTSDGRFSGRARVGGRVCLRPGSETHGELAALSLDVECGARLRVRAAIGHMED